MEIWLYHINLFIFVHFLCLSDMHHALMLCISNGLYLSWISHATHFRLAAAHAMEFFLDLRYIIFLRFVYSETICRLGIGKCNNKVNRFNTWSGPNNNELMTIFAYVEYLHILVCRLSKYECTWRNFTVSIGRNMGRWRNHIHLCARQGHEIGWIFCGNWKHIYSCFSIGEISKQFMQLVSTKSYCSKLW